MKVIEVKNLSYAYSGKKVFSDVNFTINKGEFVKLTGPNGSGKSTLIKLLIKELALRSGEINIMDKHINAFKEWDKIGYLPQNKIGGNNFPATAFEIVLTGLYNKQRLLRIYTKKDKENAKDALSHTGMLAFKDSLIGSLSGGQLQRVMIARLLAANPQILILDEPMTGLDVNAIIDIYLILNNLIKEKGVTVLMISHDTIKQDKIFDRTLCLAYGNLMELDKKQVEKELESMHTHPQKAQEK